MEDQEKIIPRYDAKRNVYTVDWPGRPEVSMPTFATLDEARSFAADVQPAQERQRALAGSPVPPQEPKLTREHEHRLRSNGKLMANVLLPARTA